MREHFGRCTCQKRRACFRSKVLHECPRDLFHSCFAPKKSKTPSHLKFARCDIVDQCKHSCHATASILRLVGQQSQSLLENGRLGHCTKSPASRLAVPFWWPGRPAIHRRRSQSSSAGCFMQREAKRTRAWPTNAKLLESWPVSEARASKRRQRNAFPI
jgi:hypothetical protein